VENYMCLREAIKDSEQVTQAQLEAFDNLPPEVKETIDHGVTRLLAIIKSEIFDEYEDHLDDLTRSFSGYAENIKKECYSALEGYSKEVDNSRKWLKNSLVENEDDK